jgi:hypothetical protein
MAQSLKRKASVIKMEAEQQRQAVDDNDAQQSSSDSFPTDDLPLERRNIAPELLDLIPEQYFDVQHNFWCSCIGCRLLRPS